MGQKYLFPKAWRSFCLAKQYLNPSPDPTYSLYDQQSNPTPCLRLGPHKLQRLRALNAQNIYSGSRLSRSASQGASAGGFGSLELGEKHRGVDSWSRCYWERFKIPVSRAKHLPGFASQRCRWKMQSKEVFWQLSYGFSSSEFGARDGEAFKSVNSVRLREI